MSVGLVLIDIQNDYLRGGKMELVEMDSAPCRIANRKGAGKSCGKNRGVVRSPRILGMRRRSDQVYFDDTGWRDDPEMR
jgi:hypothetical protein